MKILHVLDHSIPLQSGYTFRTRSILEQQRALGWKTCHVTGPKHASAVLQETVDGFEFFRTPGSKRFLGRAPVLNQLTIISSLANRIDQIVRQVNPDILHAHSPALNGVAALKVGRRRGLPVVYEVRAFWEDAAVDHGTSSEWGLRYRLTRGLETWVLRRANAVTTICEGLRGEIISRGMPAPKVTVIPNAVNLERFELTAGRDPELVRRFQLEGKTVLGFVGSFYAYEGLELLIEALPLMRARSPDVTLLLVGGGPQAGRIEQLIAERGLADSVILTGRVPHDEVQRYYSLIDVLAYPRLPMRLTDLVTPLKPLEAMAQGKLVVASDVGGHKELIQPGVTGEIFPAGDAPRLAEAVLKVISNPNDWPRRVAAGREYVEQERNWPLSVSRYRGVYEPLLGAA